MGIFCEINLCRPADGRYTYQPGSIVSGEIRYYLRDEYEFSAITVSLKGIGELYIEDRSKKRKDRRYKLTNDEMYVDLDSVVYTNEKDGPLPIGQYQNKFSFPLPYNIPPSTEIEKSTLDYFVQCNIKYYIRIKFERTGWFKLNKKYKKELIVIPGQIPRMVMEPLTYGDQKSLIQLGSLFSSKKGIVNIKATIENSVLKPEEFVKVDYEIDNSTNKTINSVQVKVFEVDRYTDSWGDEVKITTEIKGLGFTYEAIQEGETAQFTADIMIPDNFGSIDCEMLCRDYSVVAIVRLPVPHINLPLKIPFQVTSLLTDSDYHQSITVVTAKSSSYEEIACCSRDEYAMDNPPSYWEAMGEENDKKDLRKNEDEEFGDKELEEKEDI